MGLSLYLTVMVIDHRLYNDFGVYDYDLKSSSKLVRSTGVDFLFIHNTHISCASFNRSKI